MRPSIGRFAELPSPAQIATILVVLATGWSHFAASAGPGSGPSPTNGDGSNLRYVASARVQIRAVHTGRVGCGFDTHVLPEPRVIQLVPASNDVADLLRELDLAPGAYEEIRLEADSGTVVLTDEARVAEGNLFSTALGNLHMPSAAQSGIKVSITPPIVVVTRLSPELTLVLDLQHTFVFNGPPTHAPGVKRVIIGPVLHATNTSTDGRITLRVLKGNETSQCKGPATAIEGAQVTAIDRSGSVPPAIAVTDTAGRASLVVPPGVYDVVIAASGYDPVRLESQTVYLANETALGDVVFGRSSTSATFDQDRAILLAIMMTIAYADGTGRIGDLGETNEGDPLPRGEGEYVEWLETDFADYLDPCWKFVSYHDVTEGLTSTQWFVARQKTTGDLLVGVAGTTDAWDIFTDIRATKSDWTLSDGRVIEASVHTGMRNAYLQARSELLASLEDAIEDYAPDAANARVYFTGHSLGGALATLAALDLADRLVSDHGYGRNNIIMYSYGAPRVMTERLAPEFEATVPNGFAVAARDDLVPHVPDGEAGLGPNEFTQIGNLVVLSSNIPDTDEGDDGRYKDVGATRVEKSRGKRYRGCAVGGGRSVPGTDYGKKGHHQFQYIERLESIVADGIPDIWLSLNDINHLVLNWENGVQGPCDWVGLYATDRDAPAPTDADGYIALVDGWEWAVRGDGYPDEASSHATLKNPAGLIDAGKDFWIGYVDGFHRLIKTVKYTGPRSAGHSSREQSRAAIPVLNGASPNPTGDVTSLRYVLPRATDVRVVICDVAGRRVRELLRGGRDAGTHEEPWDLRDTNGIRVHSGMYFVRLEADGQSLVRPVIVRR